MKDLFNNKPQLPAIVNTKTVLWTVASAAFSVLSLVATFNRDRSVMDALKAATADDTIIIDPPTE